MSAGTETLLLHGTFQQAFAITGEFAVRSNLAGSHLRIRIDPFACGGEAVQLNLASPQHTFANRSRVFWHAVAAQLLVIHRRNIDVNVNAVHQWAGDF